MIDCIENILFHWNCHLGQEHLFPFLCQQNNNKFSLTMPTNVKSEIKVVLTGDKINVAEGELDYKNMKVNYTLWHTLSCVDRTRADDPDVAWPSTLPRTTASGPPTPALAPRLYWPQRWVASTVHHTVSVGLSLHVRNNCLHCKNVCSNY